MDQNRQLMLYRALVKDMLRKRGIVLEVGNILREVNAEVKSLNERHRFDDPLTAEEFFGEIRTLTDELMSEHSEMLAHRFAELQKGSKQR